MQRDLARHNARASEPILVRAALHAGDIRTEEDRIFGAAVNAAARVCAITDPGQILVTERVRVQLSRDLLPLRDAGLTTLRGFKEAFALHEVLWQESQ